MVSSFIIIMYVLNQNITPLPFFRGFLNTGALFLGSCMILVYLFYFIFFYFFYYVL
jgi:hypothetical protein